MRHVRRTGKWHLVQEPMDVLMLSLFVADLIQAIGAVMDVRWVHSGKVEVGAFCTAQGVVQQLGETTVAITTLVRGSGLRSFCVTDRPPADDYPLHVCGSLVS